MDVGLDEGLREALTASVGAEHVLTDDDRTAGYRTDWTGRFGGWTAAVVRPADTAEVSAVLRTCHTHGHPVVPQGGNTGLVGGGVPRAGEVVLSLRRLDHVGDADATSLSVQAGAGATLEAVQSAAAAAGLAFGVDLAARDTATVGGLIATNAGGIHVVAHGSMRAQVLGLEAVLADGRVLRRMPGLAKDNAGYDLPQLLAGSEGTLAVVTAARLRLVPAGGRRTAVLVGCATVTDLLSVLADLRGAGRFHAAELMTAHGLQVVAAHLQHPPPLDSPLVLLVELEGEVDEAALSDAVGARPVVAAQDAADARRLWRWREAHTEAVNSLGVPTKLDITVPSGALEPVIAALGELDPDAVVFGHVADGNLHINLVDAPEGREEAVLRLVADHHGSIASEHGIGIAKARWLHLTRTDEEIAVMRSIKQALDPTGLLNPGVILPQI